MWQAFFPDSVRVQDRWCCDVTVFNGSEKFVVTVFYDRSIDECLPQLRAAVAKRDAQTLKPPAPIPAGTIADLTEPIVAVLEPTADEAKAQQVRAEWFQRYVDARTQQVLASLPADVAADYLPEYGGLR